MEDFERPSEQKSELGEVLSRIDKTSVVVYEKLNASNDRTNSWRPTLHIIMLARQRKKPK